MTKTKNPRITTIMVTKELHDRLYHLKGARRSYTQLIDELVTQAEQQTEQQAEQAEQPSDIIEVD